jgi:hypothetical protein
MTPDIGFSFLIPAPELGLYQLLRDFQAGIAGILGFLGVILTLWINARLARAARLNAIEHERTSVRVAFAEELKLIEKSLKD